MKKTLIGILSAVVVFSSGMFIGKTNTVDKDTYENLKAKNEATIKQVNSTKKDLSKANKELSELKKTEGKEDNQENKQNDKQTINKEVKQNMNTEVKQTVNKETKQPSKSNVTTDTTIKESTQENTTKSSNSSSEQEFKPVEKENAGESKPKPEIPMIPEKPTLPDPIENPSW